MLSEAISSVLACSTVGNVFGFDTVGNVFGFDLNKSTSKKSFRFSKSLALFLACLSTVKQEI